MTPTPCPLCSALLVDAAGQWLRGPACGYWSTTLCGVLLLRDAAPERPDAPETDRALCPDLHAGEE